MWDDIWDFLLEKYPVIFLILSAIVITYFVTRWILHWRHRIIKTEEECGKIDTLLLPRLDTLTNSNTTLTGAISNLVVYLKTKDVSMDASLFRTQSPVQLTEVGKSILRNMGGEKYVDDNFSKLYEELIQRHIKSPLDIQNQSQIVLTTHTGDDDFSAIKTYLYNNPKYRVTVQGGAVQENPLDINLALFIMSIYMRDKVIQDAIASINRYVNQTGMLGTTDGTIQVGIKKIDNQNRILHYFTTEGLRALFPETNKPPKEKDTTKLQQIRDNPDYNKSISFDEITFFVPIHNAARFSF